MASANPTKTVALVIAVMPRKASVWSRAQPQPKSTANLAPLPAVVVEQARAISVNVRVSETVVCKPVMHKVVVRWEHLAGSLVVPTSVCQTRPPVQMLHVRRTKSVDRVKGVLRGPVVPSQSLQQQRCVAPALRTPIAPVVYVPVIPTENAVPNLVWQITSVPKDIHVSPSITSVSVWQLPATVAAKPIPIVTADLLVRKGSVCG